MKGSNVTHFSETKRWHEERNLPVGTASFEDFSYQWRRARLIAEECAETLSALLGCPVTIRAHTEGSYGGDEIGFCEAYETDIGEFLDGLADLAYVVDGSAVELGIDFDGVREEIQRSNDTKGRELDANGKLMKGPAYVPPDLSRFLPGGEG